MSNYSNNKTDLTSLPPLKRALEVIKFHGSIEFDADALAADAFVSLPIAKKALKLAKKASPYAYLETAAQPVIRFLAFKSNRTAFSTEEVYKAIAVAFQISSLEFKNEEFRNRVRWAIKKMRHNNKELVQAGQEGFYVKKGLK